ncbi:MAG: NTP transferase domain-containing protein [Guyparkeria sp.]|uniref:nucleotidyltransferase family protein n=1 Tax=Guyparkeria sp. TaxID=2035736 RepID=UPI00397E8CBE
MVADRSGPVGVVLAAGRSRRFGRDKRWATCRGRYLLAHAVETAAAVCPRVLVVVDRWHPQLDELPGQASLEVVVCPGSVAGLWGSRCCALDHLAAGGALPPGLLFFLGDMPDLRAPEAARVAARMLESGRPVRPIHAGQPGHPVAFPGRLLGALHATRGRGLKGCFGSHGGILLDCADPGVIRDVDRPEDLGPPLGAAPACRG